MKIAVTFDFGQTLADLDTAMLARRCGERGVTADATALEAAVPTAWARYDAAIREGAGGHPWKLLMRTILGEAHVDPRAIDALTDWLWDEQPRKNLWRRPIPGMFELVRALHAAKVTLGVISNSEGKLAELIDELGLGDALRIVVDSGVFGITKPDRRIFDEAAARLGVEPPTSCTSATRTRPTSPARSAPVRAPSGSAAPATTSRACGSPMTPPRPARRSRPSASRSPEPHHFGGGGRPQPEGSAVGRGGNPEGSAVGSAVGIVVGQP